MRRNRFARSAVNRKVGGSSPPRSEEVFFDFNCMLVQIWVQSKSCLSQDLFEVYYFCRLSVNESFWDLLLPLVRYGSS